MTSGEQHQHRARVSREDFREQRVVFRMDLEQRLRTEQQRRAVGQAELRPARIPRNVGAFVTRTDARKPDQPFGVVRLGIDAVPSNRNSDRRRSSRARSSPGDPMPHIGAARAEVQPARTSSHPSRVRDRSVCRGHPPGWPARPPTDAPCCRRTRESGRPVAQSRSRRRPGLERGDRRQLRTDRGRGP